MPDFTHPRDENSPAVPRSENGRSGHLLAILAIFGNSLAILLAILAKFGNSLAILLAILL